MYVVVYTCMDEMYIEDTSVYDYGYVSMHTLGMTLGCSTTKKSKQSGSEDLIFDHIKRFMTL
jgi:hypothetical protein